MPRELVTSNFSFSSKGVVGCVRYRTDLGPMRNQLSTSQKRCVGWYASSKDGRSQFWESRNDLHAFYLAEVDPRVVKYRAQPHTIEFTSHRWSLTPDREDTLADGRIEIVEVKGLQQTDEDSAYLRKLRMAEEVYADRGWVFRVIDAKEIQRQPRFRNAQAIQSFRRTVVTTFDEQRVYELFDHSPELPLSAVQSIWKSPALGFAKICALLVRRTICIDINVELSENSAVRIFTV